MKATSVAIGFAGYMLTNVAVAGTDVPPVVVVLGSALPIVGLLSVAGVSLLVGIRIVRRKR